MSVIDLPTRIDAICKKYDVDSEQDPNVTGDDAFSRPYAAVEAYINAGLQEAEVASKEKSMSSAPEVRRLQSLAVNKQPWGRNKNNPGQGLEPWWND